MESTERKKQLYLLTAVSDWHEHTQHFTGFFNLSHALVSYLEVTASFSQEDDDWWYLATRCFVSIF